MLQEQVLPPRGEATTVLGGPAWSGVASYGVAWSTSQRAAARSHHGKVQCPGASSPTWRRSEAGPS